MGQSGAGWEGVAGREAKTMRTNTGLNKFSEFQCLVGIEVVTNIYQKASNTHTHTKYQRGEEGHKFTNLKIEIVNKHKSTT